ncbi:hypothetical protein BIFANG_02347 [Bifidobacterium angulatum DSM 20098 = JCM 7096]|uniref:Uncharacterized protein n=1 Tax=Bifidobacterium angulatum DSM 20098 = JCM 7096 TaxID=518635 RepID=C4FDG3_9BIFI|nr:hypothetical protein BIFANG_02347 [Bifidobacterium angulatum DSM 20098 = JCM 7096]
MEHGVSTHVGNDAKSVRKPRYDSVLRCPGRRCTVKQVRVHGLPRILIAA